MSERKLPPFSLRKEAIDIRGLAETLVINELHSLVTELAVSSPIARLEAGFSFLAADVTRNLVEDEWLGTPPSEILI